MMCASGQEVDELASEFEAFMRSLDPADAPTLFGYGGGADVLLQAILRFATGYNVLISQETRQLQSISAVAKWVLDLSVAAVATHLRTWGARHPIIEVVCDDSKPLLAYSEFFDVMINRPDESYFTFGGNSTRLTWNMAKPIAFANSKSHAGVQIADIVAGTAAAVGARGAEAELQTLAALLAPHMSEQSILPDLQYADPSSEVALVNRIVLEELAHRADTGKDPLEGMPEFYAIVKNQLPELRKTLT